MQKYRRSRSRYQRRTGSLDITDDGAGGVVHEFDADLCHAASGTWGWRGVNFGLGAGGEGSGGDGDLPVRPRTRVTLTSLTGIFEESMFDGNLWRGLWK